MAAVGKGCFQAGRILVAVVDMAQPADTAPAPGMSAHTDLVVDMADKVGRAVRRRLRHESSRFPAGAFSAWGRERRRPLGAGR